jgi:hypothetical protein
MSRYYILTKQNGVEIVEATTVDEYHPLKIDFVLGSKTASFDRDKLLWWSSVESQPASPLAAFDPVAAAGPRGHLPTQRPFSVQGGPRDAHQQLNRHYRSSASHDALIGAASAAIPRDWKKAMLELKVTCNWQEDRYKVAYRLFNPDTQVEAFDFSEALFAAVDVFHRIAIEDDYNWNRSTLIFDRNEQGVCTASEVNFEYGSTKFVPR